MVDSVITRVATINDYQGLSEVYQEDDDYHADGLPSVFIKTSIPARDQGYIKSILEDDESILLVAEKNKIIVGLVHAQIRNTPNLPIVKPIKYAYVMDIAVRSEFRSLGIGNILMDEVKEWALSKRAHQIRLNVWNFNQTAMRFYRDLGYTVASHLMWHDLS